MRLEEKIKQAEKRIKELEEDEYFEKAERVKSLLRFALFYAQQHKNRLANYRLDKILDL